VGTFDQKVAVVTGAASGIGAASARRLAREGASVIVTDVDAEAGSAVADEIDGRFVALDVGDPDAWDDLVSSVDGVDLAHLNAGIPMGPYPVRIEQSVVADYRRVTAVNADGVFFGIRALVPAMEARGGGSIVVTASLAGLGPHEPDPVYAATKHFVIGLVRSLGAPLAELGITVNAVCPGGVDTALLEAIRHRDALRDAGRPLMDPDEIAKAAAMLLAGGETGQAYTVVLGRPPERYEFRGVPGMRP
jgi:NAD(P)-dependent dehydrogenase (short-subunit alcohol dehydrogenase family)